MAPRSKSQQTALRISASAGELFFAHGFSATTIAQVAERSDVAVGTVMLHFGSKSELATAAFADAVAEVVQRSVDAASQRTVSDLPDDLGEFVRPIYAWYSTHGDVAPDLLREALFANGEWAEHYGQTVSRTVRAFAEIIASHHQGGFDSDASLLGEGLLADYLIVLLRGLRGEFDSVDDQVARFKQLAATRFR